MFAIVNLKMGCGKNKNVSVPFKWIQGVNIIAAANDGVNCEENVKVFYSPVRFEDPNFAMDLCSTFDQNKRACYLATVNRFSGKPLFSFEQLQASFAIHAMLCYFI